MRSFKICVFDSRATGFSVTVGATTYSDSTVAALKTQLEAAGADVVVEAGDGTGPLALLALRGASALSAPVTFSYDSELGSSGDLEAVTLSVHDVPATGEVGTGLASVALLAALVGRLTA